MTKLSTNSSLINTMTIFGPTGSGLVNKNSGHHSLSIKHAKTITSCGTSYEGEIEAIKLVTDHAF